MLGLDLKNNNKGMLCMHFCLIFPPSSTKDNVDEETEAVTPSQQVQEFLPLLLSSLRQFCHSNVKFEECVKVAGLLCLEIDNTTKEHIRLNEVISAKSLKLSANLERKAGNGTQDVTTLSSSLSQLHDERKCNNTSSYSMPGGCSLEQITAPKCSESNNFSHKEIDESIAEATKLSSEGHEYSSLNRSYCENGHESFSVCTDTDVSHFNVENKYASVRVELKDNSNNIKHQKTTENGVKKNVSKPISVESDIVSNSHSSSSSHTSNFTTSLLQTEAHDSHTFSPLQESASCPHMNEPVDCESKPNMENPNTEAMSHNSSVPVDFSSPDLPLDMSLIKPEPSL